MEIIHNKDIIFKKYIDENKIKPRIICVEVNFK